MRYVLILAVWGLLTVDYWLVNSSPAMRPPALRRMTWWKWGLLPFLAVLALIVQRGFARQFIKGWWMVLGGLGVLWGWLT